MSRKSKSKSAKLFNIDKEARKYYPNPRMHTANEPFALVYVEARVRSGRTSTRTYKPLAA